MLPVFLGKELVEKMSRGGGKGKVWYDLAWGEEKEEKAIEMCCRGLSGEDSMVVDL